MLIAAGIVTLFALSSLLLNLLPRALTDISGKDIASTAFASKATVRRPAGERIVATSARSALSQGYGYPMFVGAARKMGSDRQGGRSIVGFSKCSVFHAIVYKKASVQYSEEEGSIGIELRQ